MLAHGEGLHGGVLARASHESGFVVMRQALPQGRSRKGLDEAMVTVSRQTGWYKTGTLRWIKGKQDFHEREK